VFTWGRTRAEALASAREAIEPHLESYIERGKSFPTNRQPRMRSAVPGQTPDNGSKNRLGAAGSQVVTIEVRVPEPTLRRN
jgi:hypothetical protein